ncbi:uncharacterized protein [Dermacentor albipictus]|uniref:uncharacterized protein isoform X2 n=1 Tax=Dermacentor albipictus TaxID=60249 RepID=UPI0038FC37EA
MDCVAAPEFRSRAKWDPLVARPIGNFFKRFVPVAICSSFSKDYIRYQSHLVGGSSVVWLALGWPQRHVSKCSGGGVCEAASRQLCALCLDYRWCKEVPRIPGRFEMAKLPGVALSCCGFTQRFLPVLEGVIIIISSCSSSVTKELRKHDDKRNSVLLNSLRLHDDEVLAVLCSVAAIVSITLIVVVAVLAATGIVSVNIRSNRALPQRSVLNHSADHSADKNAVEQDGAKTQHHEPSKGSSSASAGLSVQQRAPQSYRRKFGH